MLFRSPFDGGQSLVQNQGFVNGLFYDDNGSGGGKTRADLMHAGDIVKVGLAGSIRDYRLATSTDEVRELQRISVGVGLIAALASSGLMRNQLSPLSPCSGAPAPKLLSV